MLTSVSKKNFALHGAAQLVKQLDDARFVVWLNPFWGPVADDGKTFEQMKIYQDIKKRIETIVNLPAFTDFSSADAVNTTTGPQLPKYVSAAFGSLELPWKPGHLRSA